MNDINKVEAELADIDGVETEVVKDIDLDELYSEMEVDGIDDIESFGDDTAVVPVATSKGGKEKMWLVLTFLFFILALRSSSSFIFLRQA